MTFWTRLILSVWIAGNHAVCYIFESSFLVFYCPVELFNVTVCIVRIKISFSSLSFFSVFYSSSGGISSLSPSGRDAVDPIAELLSQLSGVRRNNPAQGSASAQLQQLQMQLQLERQQVRVSTTLIWRSYLNLAGCSYSIDNRGCCSWGCKVRDLESLACGSIWELGMFVIRILIRGRRVLCFGPQCWVHCDGKFCKEKWNQV